MAKLLQACTYLAKSNRPTDCPDWIAPVPLSVLIVTFNCSTKSWDSSLLTPLAQFATYWTADEVLKLNLMRPGESAGLFTRRGTRRGLQSKVAWTNEKIMWARCRHWILAPDLQDTSKYQPCDPSAGIEALHAGLISPCISQALHNYLNPFIGQEILYLHVFCPSWAIVRSPSSIRIIDICLYFANLEQLSDPLHRSGWLIFACILQVLSNYPIPFIAQDDWYLLVFYKSWAIIRSPLSVRMIDICLYFTSLEQLSDPLHCSRRLIFACILPVLSNYPIPFIGQDDWYLLVFFKSWAMKGIR